VGDSIQYIDPADINQYSMADYGFGLEEDFSRQSS
jgi:hypothetical protein